MTVRQFGRLEVTVMEAAAVVVFLLVVALAALLGADTRDGRDWQPREAARPEHRG